MATLSSLSWTKYFLVLVYIFWCTFRYDFTPLWLCAFQIQPPSRIAFIQRTYNVCSKWDLFWIGEHLSTSLISGMDPSITHYCTYFGHLVLLDFLSVVTQQVLFFHVRSSCKPSSFGDNLGENFSVITSLWTISRSISGSILWIISGIIFGQISIILLCYIFVNGAKYYRTIGKNGTKRSHILKLLCCLFYFSTNKIEESIQLRVY